MKQFGILTQSGEFGKPMLVFIILAAIYMGWSMGANDGANCVGVDIGSGVMKLRHGIIITCVFSVLGAVFLGGNVIKTIGRGVVAMDLLPADQAGIVALVSLFGAALWVTLASYKKYPVSTSHSIIGAVTGSGLALNTAVNWIKVVEIFVSWILTPVGSALIAIAIYPVLRRIFMFPAIKRNERKIIVFLLYTTSAYFAFTWGANDVANATGILYGTEKFTPTIAGLLGGVAITIGVVTWGYRIIETVGFKIAHITPLMTIAIEIAASANVHIYTHFGIPVSTSHSIIGGLWGVGLLQGIKTMNLKLIKEIVLAWAFTPLISGIITYLLVSLFLMFGK